MPLLGIIHFVAAVWPLLLLTVHLNLLFLLTHGTNAQIADSSLSLSVALLWDSREHLLIESVRLSLRLAEELLTDTLGVHP